MTKNEFHYRLKSVLLTVFAFSALQVGKIEINDDSTKVVSLNRELIGTLTSQFKTVFSAKSEIDNHGKSKFTPKFGILGPLDPNRGGKQGDNLIEKVLISIHVEIC